MWCSTSRFLIRETFSLLLLHIWKLCSLMSFVYVLHLWCTVLIDWEAKQDSPWRPMWKARPGTPTCPHSGALSFTEHLLPKPPLLVVCNKSYTIKTQMPCWPVKKVFPKNLLSSLPAPVLSHCNVAAEECSATSTQMLKEAPVGQRQPVVGCALWLTLDSFCPTFSCLFIWMVYLYNALKMLWKNTCLRMQRVHCHFKPLSWDHISF